MLLLDGQVHHDTHAIPMGNYVSAAGNYVSVSPSELGNYVSADTQLINPAVTATFQAKTRECIERTTAYNMGRRG